MQECKLTSMELKKDVPAPDPKRKSKNIVVDWELWKYIRDIKDEEALETMADTMRAIIKKAAKHDDNEE